MSDGQLASTQVAYGKCARPNRRWFGQAFHLRSQLPSISVKAVYLSCWRLPRVFIKAACCYVLKLWAATAVSVSSEQQKCFCDVLNLDKYEKVCAQQRTQETSVNYCPESANGADAANGSFVGQEATKYWGYSMKEHATLIHSLGIALGFKGSLTRASRSSSTSSMPSMACTMPTLYI